MILGYVDKKLSAGFNFNQILITEVKSVPVEKINQFDLFYIEHGKGLPNIVMHGRFGMDHMYLDPWLDPLRDVLNLVYYDHCCNGRSSYPSINILTFPKLCADANALREYLGFSKIVLIGHSYGGFISLEYALRYPETLSHLVLVGTLPAFKNDRGVIANVKRKGATKEMMVALRLHNPVFNRQFQDPSHVILPLYFGKLKSNT
ncbi:MAG: alpha/beta hydrolase [Thermodesulfobacteriota bacterium]|nr:alpha/beta hydrolase [Thermodesulfobacteriota bacterium]